MSQILAKLSQLRNKLPNTSAGSVVKAPERLEKKQRRSLSIYLRLWVGNTKKFSGAGTMVASAGFIGSFVLLTLSVLLVPPPRHVAVQAPKAQAEVARTPAQAPIQVQAPTSAPASPSANVEQLLRQASEHLKKDQLDQSAEALTRVIQIDPTHALAYNNLGMIQLRKKNPTAALPYFERAAKLAQNSPELMLNLGITYEQVQEWSKAAQSYQNYLELMSQPQNKASGLSADLKVIQAARFRMSRLRAWARAQAPAPNTEFQERSLAGEEDDEP